MDRSPVALAVAAAVGLLAAAGLIATGVDRSSVALAVAAAATCYVAAAAFSLPWTAWAWIPVSFAVVLASAPAGLDPLAATVVSAALPEARVALDVPSASPSSWPYWRDASGPSSDVGSGASNGEAR